MIGPGDALDWVEKLAEKVEQPSDSKAKIEARVAESARAAGFKKLQINEETGEISREERLNPEAEAPKKKLAPGSFREALQPCPFCEVKHA